MNPPTQKPVIFPGYENKSSGPNLRRIVRMSALFNLAIVVTCFPLLIFVRGAKAFGVTLAFMGGSTNLIWATTFTLFLLISLARIIWTLVSSLKRSDPPDWAEETGVADRWLDGPV